MFDCHIHSSFSPDSKITPKEGCLQALKKNLNGLSFTDHVDLDFPNRLFVTNCDFIKRSKLLDSLKEEFVKDLKILKGLELGFQPHTFKKSEEIVKGYDFDFVISSLHALDGFDIAQPEYLNNKTEKVAFERYLQGIYQAVCDFKNYDVIGHIGYLRRYVNFDGRKMLYQDYSDIIDSILRKVIEDEKGIEVNSSGYRVNLESPIPGYDILKRYKELGGDILTIGSDSHSLEHIGHSFDIIRDNLKKLDFTYLTYFENRKPVFYKI